MAEENPLKKIYNIITGSGEAGKDAKTVSANSTAEGSNWLTELLSNTSTQGASVNPLSALSDFNLSNVTALSEAVTKVAANYQILIEGAQNFANSMGIGQARASELQLTIANTTPELVKLGLNQTQITDIFEKTSATIGTNTILSKDTMVELGATTKFTGIESSKLAKSFKDAGFEIGAVGEKMAEVANYAKSVGTNVAAVTALVNTNLKQLNLFNFQNGVEGLGKMAARSTMLGYEMKTVVDQAEKLLSPDKAIEFSSALQRLGVAGTELLDPLSAMDIAMNNPEKMATELEKVAKQFVQMKADGSGFEIMPGAKLRLREIAKETGIAVDELINMGVRGSELDMKLKQIRFPSFAASEEDRTLIANMAEMKDGRAIVQIEEGDELKSVAVEDLTADQLEQLRKDQANQNKTAEELAADQLNVLQKIAANTAGGVAAAKMGVASAGPIKRYIDMLSETRLAMTTETVGKFEVEWFREQGTKALSGLESGLKTFVENPSVEALAEVATGFVSGVESLGNTAKEIVMAGGESMTKIASSMADSFNKIYKGQDIKVGDTKGFLTEFSNTIDNTKNELDNTTSTTSNINVNQQVEVVFKSDGSVDMSTIEQYMKQDQFQMKFNESIQNLNQDPKNVNAVKQIMNNDSRMP
jgi:hypothetical protein